MPRTYSRAEWGTRPARGGPGPLYASTVTSLALHWPAMTKPLRDVAAVMAALRAWQAYHMDTHGWSDIGYQVAADQWGNRYILRGLDVQSGANGDEAANKANGAVLLILAPGEQPTPAMIEAVRDIVADHRALFAKSRGVKGHSDVRPEPTSCPGPIVLAMIRAGDFEPQPKRKPIRRGLRKITAGIKQLRQDGYTRVADRFKGVREGVRDRHGR